MMYILGDRGPNSTPTARSTPARPPSPPSPTCSDGQPHGPSALDAPVDRQLRPAAAARSRRVDRPARREVRRPSATSTCPRTSASDRPAVSAPARCPPIGLHDRRAVPDRGRADGAARRRDQPGQPAPVRLARTPDPLAAAGPDGRRRPLRRRPRRTPARGHAAGQPGRPAAPAAAATGDDPPALVAAAAANAADVRRALGLPAAGGDDAADPLRDPWGTPLAFLPRQSPAIGMAPATARSSSAPAPTAASLAGPTTSTASTTPTPRPPPREPGVAGYRRPV